MPASIAIGTMAYNEEANIGRLLDSMLAQSAGELIRRIVVVASGCTDRTCEIVRRYQLKDSRIELIAEAKRSGKVAAINEFLFSSTEEILIVSSADLVYAPRALEELIAPFADPEVGMTGAHSISSDAPTTFFGYAATLMWQLHHEISLQAPKMGELIAFRNVFRRLNPAIISDELSVHQVVASLGYKVVYVPDAIVYNKGAENLEDFLSQRMRCIVGNLQIMRDHNVPISTMRIVPVMRAGLPYVYQNWRRFHWTAGTAALELYCRLKGSMTYRSRKSHTRYKVWEPASTTKTLPADLEPTTPLRRG
ncbi:MAG: glycosyltransferase [Candidatus Eremiobacter antarcticus]|nr:glycosyltransferase [Candidatus Eremiobacteraeota bacterium]MBC5808053.1 glycosyltransferase [Candidatus Eremiobacteraeota bacterium]